MLVLTMATTNPTPSTVPSPSDQAIPVRRPISLDQLALAQGVTPEHVGQYVRAHAAFLSARYRYSRTDIGLQAVSQ